MKNFTQFTEADLNVAETEAVAADRIAEGEDFISPDDNLSLWAKEARRRLEEYRSGLVAAIPGDEVFARLRKRLKE